MKEFWNERYEEEGFAYGIAPNEFFKNNIAFLGGKSKLLFPAEGEGRNAVFAAQNGFDVYAFDYSESTKSKALEFAKKNSVKINYSVFDVLQCNYQENSFDALVLIFAHFPKDIRNQAHKRLLTFLKPGGKIIFEAYSKEQLENNSDGPKNIEMLFSEKEIKEEFPNIVFEQFEKKTIHLNEGKYHQGEASVIRFLAVKE